MLTATNQKLQKLF